MMVPPAPVTDRAVPSAKTPVMFPAAIGTDEVPGAEASVTVTAATTPSGIAIEFIPTAKHVNDTGAALQFSVLPAAVRAGPAAILTEGTSAGA